MANKAGRSILVPVMLINSAVLALLLLVCQLNGQKEPVANRLPRVAGAQAVRLTGQSVALEGYGKVSASGELRLEATAGSFAVVSNSGVATVNGQLLPVGRIMRVTEPTDVVIEGSDIYAELTGSPLRLVASGTGGLIPDIRTTPEVPQESPQLQ